MEKERRIGPLGVLDESYSVRVFVSDPRSLSPPLTDKRLGFWGTTRVREGC